MLGFFVGLLIGAILSYIILIKSEKEIRSIDAFYKKELEKEYRDKAFWINQAKILQKESLKKTEIIINKDILKAIKKAVIYSHPDKGNCDNNEDFIKFKKLYDELKVLVD